MKKSLWNMPFFWQQTGYWCGPALLQMLLKFYGIFRPQAHLARVSGTTRKGLNVPDLRRALSRYGISSRSRFNGTLTDIGRILTSGRPVAVAYVEPDDEDPHYALVVRLTKRYVVMRDPWHGPNFRMTRREFLSRWQSERRWMLVPTGRTA